MKLILRHLLLLMIAAILFGNVYAQQQEQLSNLMAGLEVSETEEDTFYYLEEIYYYWLNIDYDSADVYARKYHNYAIEVSNKKNESIGLNYIGIVYDYRGDVSTASDYYNQALSIREDLGDKRLIGNSLSNIGALYYHAGDIDRATEYYFNALEIREEIQDSSGLSQSYNNLGILLRSQGEYEQALEYYQLSAEYKKAIGREYSAMYTMLNMGSLYIFMQEYQNAIDISQEALAIAEKYQDLSSVASLKLNIGTAQSSLQQFDEGRANIREGIADLESIGELTTAFEGYTMLISSYLDLNDYTRAERIIRDIERREEYFIEPSIVQEFYKSASVVYSELGRYEDAFRYKLLEDEIKDSLFDANSKQALLELETKYELSEREQELALLATQNQLNELELNQSKIIRNYTIFLALLLLGIMVFVIRNSRLIRKLNGELKDSLDQKDVLMKEIHHRVKNNLQIISSLLSIQSRKVDDEETASALKESKSRVQSMALIHQSLYQKENLTEVQIKEYIEQLVQTLLNSFGASEQIDLNLDIEDIRLDVDTTIPLGLIINELVTNVVKYAFEPDQKGKLSILLKEFENQLRLEIKDNGKGMDDEHRKEGSFGMSMVQSLSQKLNAELIVETDKGTQIRLDIKEFKKAS